LWLMSRVTGYAPVMEYCGGTEIGGSFLSSTVVQPNAPAMFATPVLGSALCLLKDTGGFVSGSGAGEIALMPPPLGLSTTLLNRNHFETYYAYMPSGANGETLRKHGDEIEQVFDAAHDMPYYRALGRCDDTMNLGGIKISSVEIERVCNTTRAVLETAAIAIVPVGGGPCVLVMYVVLKPGTAVYRDMGMHNWLLLEEPTGSEKDDSERAVVANGTTLKSLFQNSIKRSLNPLFHVNDIVVVDALPRTASNKVMRRVMRDEYLKLEHVVVKRQKEAAAMATTSC
jgi:acetyl-CoA synthetase